MPPKKKAATGAGIKAESSSRPSSSAAGQRVSKTARLLHEQLVAISPALKSQDEVNEMLPDKAQGQIAEAVNELLGYRMIEIQIQNGNEIMYRGLRPQEAARLSDLDPDDEIVYQIVQSVAADGIYLAALRKKSNLPQVTVTNVIKRLESKQMIKQVKNVEKPTQKWYMLYDLEPSASLSGGVFYSDDGLDEGFILGLSEGILKFLKDRTWPKKMAGNKIRATHFVPDYTGCYPNATEIHKWVKSMGITNTELTVSDIMQLLDVLIYDGKIEKRPDGMTYSAVRDFNKTAQNPFVEAPCGNCPVFNVCEEGGPVNPGSCVYYQDWLGDLGDGEEEIF
ncbi:RNA polymerase Rpc34 [Saitoella complicata NRRL Y-17804]|uniref:RNA polymerase Rpc34 n=1 Tax=Saitoella complicata (strain BCRC 22490 / CBS 7301 / JCM 7358 / NBRC 10748 / NRRL Y-17804) TaxID=698492 RepID=UPI000867629E|nr:RNA polymerase Rpc34 [Saitoella complicata NRRL Y-17804]ODQ54770.1 RNA polymerase Rpc34 [Saitoella complicata NRRL Y-17804]